MLVKEMTQTGPVYTVDLPSQGLVYNDILDDGKVQIKPLNTNDEKVIVDSSSINEIENAYLDRGMILPKGFAHRDMVTGDRMFCFFMIRAISYGPFYDFKFRCDVCNKETSNSVDVRELPVKNLPDGFSEPYKISLPSSGDTVEIRLFRGHDEEAIFEFLNPKNSKVSGKPRPSPKTFELGRILYSINGEKLDRSSNEARMLSDIRAMEYIGNLIPWDSGTIQMVLQDIDPGLNLTTYINCKNHMCKAENEVLLTIEREFFRPSRINR